MYQSQILKDSCLGKLNSASVLPDSQTTVTNKHLKNHFGKEHSWLQCGDEVKWRTSEDIARSLAEAIDLNGGSVQCTASREEIFSHDEVLKE